MTRKDSLLVASKSGELDRFEPEHIREMLHERDEAGMSALVNAIAYGQLHNIPRELITKENMLVKDPVRGYTPMHWAAQLGFLDLLPAELITKENLLTPDDHHWTPLHSLARHGHIDTLPLNLLTEENLLVPSKTGRTCLEILRENNELDKILGIQLSESSKEIVGAAWFQRNQKVVQARKELETNSQEPEIELY